MEYIAAIATAVLAVLTAIYVAITSKLASQATESSKAAARAADAAERMLLVEGMPVITPALGGSSLGGSRNTADIQLFNEGRHAALNVTVRYTADDGRTSQLLHVHRVPPVGELREVQFMDGDAAMIEATRQGEFRIDVEYEDPLGHKYRSEAAQHVPDDGSAAKLRIRTFRQLDGRWIPMVGA